MKQRKRGEGTNGNDVKELFEKSVYAEKIVEMKWKQEQKTAKKINKFKWKKLHFRAVKDRG